MSRIASTHPSTRWWSVLALVCALLATTLWVLQARAFGVVAQATAASSAGSSMVAYGDPAANGAATSSVSGSAPTASPAPAPTPARACTAAAGTPVRVSIPGLGVDAAVEVLHPIDGSIGDPKNKANLGWFPEWPSVKPGSGHGAVLMDGHTYHDGSAVFAEDFDHTDKLGMPVTVTLDNGSVCRYRVIEQYTVAAQDYESFVQGQDLYDLDQRRPERLVVATCSGWNGRTHTTESVVVASPVG